MMDVWLILLPAFIMMLCLLLTHCYFGLHILARGIIFADLALAQIAALGTSVAFLMGEQAHGINAQIYAFAATFIAAAMFSQFHRIQNTTTREVTIGCVYVVSAALSIVILSRSAQGMEELKSMLNGNILWVSWQEIIVIAILYLMVAVFHYIYRQKFYQLSFAKQFEKSRTYWEFLFFLSFAIIITLAVKVAGVLLVFALLIIPAFSASLIQQSFKARLLLSWILGIAGSLAGLFVAVQYDLPVGATVVSLLGVLPLLAGTVITLRRMSAG